MRDRAPQSAFRRRLAAAALPRGPGDDRPVRAEEVDGLDEPVRRFMHFMGVVDRPRVWSFTVDFAGRFRLRPDGPWMPAAGRQYNSVLAVGRVFTMRLRMARVVPMLGHDTYLSGVGRMRGKMAGLFTVADGSGTEFDVGELSTWLNDAVLLAPSMLLTAPSRWTATDHDTFEVTMDDSGHHVSATVVVDERGAPVDYWTTDRWAAMPDGLVRARWRLPVSWVEVGGRPWPAPAPVTWDLPTGPFTYVEGGFVPGTLRTNLAPSEAALR